METHASYVAVGAFVVALLVGLVVAVLWLAHGQVTENAVRYETYFASVGSGLGQGSPVSVSGVQVGHVASVDLVSGNPPRVRVLVDVSPTAPIRSDSVASVEVQNLTGAAAIEITPGRMDAPPITVEPGHRYGMLWSRESNLQQIAGSLPELVAKLTTLTDRLTQLVGDKNRAAIAETIDNLRQVTAVAAAHRRDLGDLLADGAADARDLRQAIGNLDAAAQRFDQVAGQAGTALHHFDGLVQENRGAIKSFTANELNEIEALTADTRRLVAELSRSVETLDRDPSRFLYGDRRQGYRPQ